MGLGGHVSSSRFLSSALFIFFFRTVLWRRPCALQHQCLCFLFLSEHQDPPFVCLSTHAQSFHFTVCFPHILYLMFTTACEKGVILLSSQAQRGKAVCPKSQSDQKWWDQEYQVPLGATPGAFSPEPGPPLGHTPPPSPCQPHLVTGHP